MKHKGSTSDFKEDRNRELLAVFASEFSHPTANVRNVWGRIACRGVSRFYVSEPRALAVVHHRHRTGHFPVMSSLRREMFEEIYGRYLSLKESHPHLSDADIIYMVVNSPAPSFYLTPGTIRTLIYALCA